MENEIDFVILWLDSTDPKWIDEYNKYSKTKLDVNNIRYRNNDLFKYLFRSIEKFTPWVRKIHLVTFGHFPSWLNLNHGKLNLVKHTDFIPEKYLPTFNSHTIELNLHRIKGISDQFVYFNDDMYILKNLEKEYFFKNTLPCDTSILSSFVPTYDMISNICFNNLNVINKYYSMIDIKSNISKWINCKYGKYAFKNYLYIKLNRISSFEEDHLPHSFKKNIFETVWKKEYDLLNATCLHKFRDVNDVNQWLLRYWQFCSSSFEPRKYQAGAYRQLDYNIQDTVKIIEQQKYPMICINDSNIDNFEKEINKLEQAFELILPNKSSFETD